MLRARKLTISELNEDVRSTVELVTDQASTLLKLLEVAEANPRPYLAEEAVVLSRILSENIAVAADAIIRQWEFSSKDSCVAHTNSMLSNIKRRVLEARKIIGNGKKGKCRQVQPGGTPRLVLLKGKIHGR